MSTGRVRRTRPRTRTWKRWKRDRDHFTRLFQDSNFEDMVYPAKEETTVLTRPQRFEKELPFSKTFNAHPIFKGFSNQLNITKTVKNGRCVVTTETIDFHEKVIECEAYVSVVDRTEHKYCLTCNEVKLRTGNRWLKCDECRMTYCSEECKTKNQTHKYTCNTMYDAIEFGDKIKIKCAIEMVLKALAIYNEELHQLQKWIYDNQKTFNKVPVFENNMSDDKFSFSCVMRLQADPYPTLESECIEAYWLIEQLPLVIQKFNTPTRKSLLENLLAHNLMILNHNSFHVNLCGTVKRILLFDTVSFINHSCTPNATQFFINNKIMFFTTRKITQGEHLTFSYVKEFHSHMHTKDRRKILRQKFDFICRCDRCTNYADELSEGKLREERAKWLSVPKKDRKHGHAFFNLLRDYDRTVQPVWTRKLAATIIVYCEWLTDIYYMNVSKNQIIE